ncbi:MAG: helix-turn-helix domain-containing protein [Nitriliruptoraceae bacterium]
MTSSIDATVSGQRPRAADPVDRVATQERTGPADADQERPTTSDRRPPRATRGPAAAVNRGPAAAASNRAALLAAARDLFAQHGSGVPLSAIARQAGVGQGSLYRHFPTRVDLALAVFEDNVTELEALASGSTEPASFARLWQRLLALTLESVAFIEVAVDAREELASAGLGERLRHLLDASLAHAQAAGELAPELTVDDLALVLRMVYGVLVSEPEPGRARAAMGHALALVDPRLTLDDHSDPTAHPTASTDHPDDPRRPHRPRYRDDAHPTEEHP